MCGMDSVLREGDQASRGQDWGRGQVCSHRDIRRRAVAEAAAKVGGLCGQLWPSFHTAGG